MPRPAKTTAEHRLAGSFRQDRHGDRADAQLDPSRVTAPAWLSPESVPLFEQLAADLQQLTAGIDAVAVAMLANALHDYHTARALVLQQGMVMEGSEGQPVQHPAMRIAQESWGRVILLLKQFGMTPVARASLKLPPPFVSPFDNSKAKYFLG